MSGFVNEDLAQNQKDFIATNVTGSVFMRRFNFFLGQFSRLINPHGFNTEETYCKTTLLGTH